MFKPMLAPNQSVDLESIKYPMFASHKLDGIRGIFIDGKLLSRSLKPINNIVIQQMFAKVKQYTVDTGNIIDGELYAEGLSFQEITSYVMSKDKPVPQSLKFYAFDYIQDGNDLNFEDRLAYLQIAVRHLDDSNIVILDQRLYFNPDQVMEFYNRALGRGYEGLILKCPLGIYKYNRVTMNENLMFKLKPFVTFDGIVVDVVQATIVDPAVEKKTNELGRSVTSKKIGDRLLVNKAAAFIVDYEGSFVSVTLAMTDEDKMDVWSDRYRYIGRTIEYKGMLVGAKDVPRHPVFLRFKSDE